jgi:hypothetical protein
MCRAASILVAVLLALPAVAIAQRPNPPSRDLIAILDLDSVGATTGQVSAASERLREEFAIVGQYRLVDRAQIKKILDEQALQQTGCTTQECAVQVGRILGVRKLVTGRVTKVEEGYWLLSGAIIDVESAETVAIGSVQHGGNFPSLLGDGVRQLALKLLQQTTAVALPSAPPGPSAPDVRQPAAAAGKPAPAGPRVSRSFALMPMVLPRCGSGAVNCGVTMVERDVAQLLAGAMNRISGVQLARNAYAEEGSPAAIGGESDLRETVWRRGLLPDPDLDRIVREGQRLGVNAVLLAIPTYVADAATFNLFVIDVNNRRVYSERFTVHRAQSGTINAAEFTAGLAGALSPYLTSDGGAGATISSAAATPESLPLSPPLQGPAGARTIAFLPMTAAQCLGGVVNCGATMPEASIATVTVRALGRVPGVFVSRNAYAAKTSPTAFPESPGVREAIWQGGNIKEPNVQRVAGEGERLGVEGVLLVATIYNSDSANYTVTLVDVAQKQALSTRFSLHRNQSGDVSQSEFTERLASALQPFAARKSFGTPVPGAPAAIAPTSAPPLARIARTVAQFPMIYAPCTAGVLNCGAPMPETTIAQMTARALTRIPGLTMIRNAYAEEGSPAAIDDASQLKSAIWKGTFVKEPDVERAAAEGKRLGANVVLMMIPTYNSDSANFNLYLIDVATLRMHSKRLQLHRNQAGEVSGPAFDAGVVDAYTAFANPQ